jgi:hypothetical protein
LQESNRWAGDLNRDLEERRARVVELQTEVAAEQESGRRTVAGYEAKVRELEADVQSKIEWAHNVETALTSEITKQAAQLTAQLNLQEAELNRQSADLNRQTAELVKAVEALHHTEKELQERTEWAVRLDKESTELARQLELYRGSRWVKLGRKVGLGPANLAS